MQRRARVIVAAGLAGLLSCGLRYPHGGAQAEVLKHLRNAVEHGKQGRGDGLVAGAKAAEQRAIEALVDEATYPMEGALIWINEAVTLGEIGKVGEATAFLEEAVKVLGPEA